MGKNYQNINLFAHPINFVYENGRMETKFLDDITCEGRIKYRITRIRAKEIPRGIQKSRTLEGFMKAVSSVRTENPEKIRISVYE
ncbi:hypothetical protein HY449_04690 [Candidatus Pacearchaeota archaeon]|nr:hypothetical protein [Candidatus Pacearchaeota archaeon]